MDMHEELTIQFIINKFPNLLIFKIPDYMYIFLVFLIKNKKVNIFLL